MNSKKSKLTSANPLPSLYTETLIKSELDYRREIRRKINQLQQDSNNTIRRRLAHDHVFTQEHLTKRYQWFHFDKTYRESCRNMWNKQTTEKNSTNRFFLPRIYPKERSVSMKNIFQINENENPIITDEKIKQKFLYIQPVMVEILNAPHSSQIMRSKQNLELRKKSAQQKQNRIQNNVMDDQRYQKLVYSLQET